MDGACLLLLYQLYDQNGEPDVFSIKTLLYVEHEVTWLLLYQMEQLF